MRILALCVYGKNVTGYGPFESLNIWCRAVTQAFPDVYIYFVVPKKTKRFPCDEERIADYVSGERIEPVRVEMLKSGINQWAAVPLEVYDLFNIERTNIYFDAVASHWIGSHPVLKKALRRKYDRNLLDVPLFGFSGRVGHDSMSVGTNEIMAQTFGYCFDYMIFKTAVERDIGLKDCRQYLSSSMVRRVKSRSLTQMMGGLNTPALDKLVKKKQKGRKLILGYGGRFDSDKGFVDVLDVFSKVQALRDVEVVCTTGESDWSDSAKIAKRYPSISFKYGVSKAKFHKYLSMWDLGVSFSVHESVGVGWQEMMYSGVAVVYLDKP